jgi:hypothetical protein
MIRIDIAKGAILQGVDLLKLWGNDLLMLNLSGKLRLAPVLNAAAAAAFELQNNTELPMNMKRFFKQLNDYAADLMEYEDNLPTNND